MSIPAGPDVCKPTDWFKIDRIVIENCPGIRPREIDDLTLSEITLIISDPNAPRPMEGRGASMTNEDIEEGLAAWKAMSARDKLEWMRVHG
jgi:hypothetical protein